MKHFTISAMEIRLLSELIQHRQGISPAGLAKSAAIHLPSAYVFLRRLARRDLVQSQPDTKRTRARTVVYVITPQGRKARQDAARQMGLKT